MSQDKRSQILEATAELIAAQGLHSCPMAKVAKNAGVGAGTIYRYFETKEALVEQLYRYICQNLADICLQNYPHQASIRQRLNHIWSHFYNFMLENPRELSLLDQLWASPALGEKVHQKAMTEINSVTLNLLEEAKIKGEIKPLQNELLLTFTFGSLFNIASKQLQTPGLLTETVSLADLLDLCWNAIKR